MGKEKKKARYFNFPIGLLDNAFVDIKGACNSIMLYEVGAYALENGEPDDVENFEEATTHKGIAFGNLKIAMKEAQKVIDRFRGESPPMVGINTDIVWDYFKNPKTQYQIALFCAFAAFKSIIGPKDKEGTATHSGDQFLIARMAGHSTIEDYEYAFNTRHSNSENIERLQPFITEYKLPKKVKLDLQKHWGLKYYSYRSRGFWCSFRLEKSDLVRAQEIRSQKTFETQKRNEEKELRERIRAELRNKKPPK